MENKQLEREIRTLKSSFDDVIYELTSEIESNESTMIDLIAENDILKDKINDLQDRVQDLLDEVESLENEIRYLNKTGN